MKSAAKSPVSTLLVHSFARRYVEMDVNPANTGAKNTQMFLISIGKVKKSRVHLIMLDVTMIPGKIVPPMTLPSGCQDSESYQFQKS